MSEPFRVTYLTIAFIMSDSEFFNNIKSTLTNPEICNAKTIGETDNFELFLKQIIVLGYGFVKIKTTKYYGNYYLYLFI